MSWLTNLFGGNRPDFQELLENGAIIIDVRSPQEYKGGHVNKSRNIPLQTIASKTANIKKMNKPVITVCASGMRSGQAAGILRNAGVEVYNGGSWSRFR